MQSLLPMVFTPFFFHTQQILHECTICYFMMLLTGPFIFFLVLSPSVDPRERKMHSLLAIWFQCWLWFDVALEVSSAWVLGGS